MPSVLFAISSLLVHFLNWKLVCAAILTAVKSSFFCSECEDAQGRPSRCFSDRHAPALYISYLEDVAANRTEMINSNIKFYI